MDQPVRHPDLPDGWTSEPFHLEHTAPRGTAMDCDGDHGD